jgi:DNA-binding GntR family transcriptional regulator
VTVSVSSTNDRSVDRGPQLGKQIAEVLRRDILLGVLSAGTRLSQQQLCARFGTSRMPVRDGLRLLAHEGLVTTDATQHAVVVPISRADLLDAYLIEGTLTGLAAERASENAVDKDIAELTELHAAMLKSTVNGDNQRMAELNWQFHRRINRLARSRKLLSAIKITSVDLPRDFLAEMPEWGPQSNVEHAQILAAMGEKRHDDVGRLMKQHIVNSGVELVTSLVERGAQLD